MVWFGIEPVHFSSGLHARNDPHVTREIKRGEPDGYIWWRQRVDTASNADQRADSDGTFQCLRGQDGKELPRGRHTSIRSEDAFDSLM